MYAILIRSNTYLKTASATKITTMKYYIVFIASLFLYSCSGDNIDLITEEALPQEPVVTEIENSILLGRSNAPTVLTPGDAYISGQFYLIASDGVIVECPGGLSTTWNGVDDFFHMTVVEDSGEFYIINTFYTIEVDGLTTTVRNVIPVDCGSANQGSISITVENDRLKGTFSDEFYRINPQWSGPQDDCEAWISVGTIDASFDVPVVCQ